MSIRYLSGINVDANTLFVDSANDRVGIGTASPAYKLDVAGGDLRVSSNSNTRLLLLNTSGSGLNYSIYSADTGNLIFGRTGIADYMTLTSAGNVGIGTTSPSAYSKLQVKVGTDFNLAIGQDTGAVGIGAYNDAVNATANLNITGTVISFSSGGERMRITSAGNVGIGTTAPGAKLEVVAGNTTSISVRSGNSGQYSILSVGRTSSDIIIASAASSGQFWTGSSDGDGWVGSTNGTLSLGNDTTGVANLTIKAGNVGIGTTSPNAPLHVIKDLGTSVSAVTRLRGSNSTARTTRLQFEDYNGTLADGLIDFVIPTAGSATGARLDIGVDSAIVSVVRGGNVGIGTTSPLGPIEVYRSNTGGLGGHIIVNNNGTAVGNETAVIFGDGASNGFRAAISSTTENAPYYGDLKFKTGANVYSSLTTKMIITGAGNVGIGTTAPTGALHVVGSSGNSTKIFYDLDVYNTLFLTNSSFVRQSGIVGDSGNLIFLSNGSSERMRITSAGNVGIGTTSPRASEGTPLTLESSTGYVGISLSGTGSYSNVWQLYASGDGASNKFFGIYDRTNGAYRLVTTSAGNVGIGTTAPAQKLHVDGAIRLTSNPSVTGDGSSAQFWNEAGVGPTIAGANFQVRTNGNTTALHINSSQNVGIGTTSPHQKLVVDGLAYLGGNSATSGLVLGTLSSVPFIQGYDPSGTNNTILFYTGVTEKMRITSGGNVGIGTSSPLAKLHVEGGGGNGTAWFGGTSVVSHFNYSTDEHTYIRGGKSTSSVYIADNNTGNVFIANGGGNVGIGTTSPSYKLQVEGAGRFSNGASGTLIIKHNYFYHQPNWGIKLDGDTGSSGGYLSQYVDIGGFELAQGATYYGGGPWLADSNSTTYSAVVGNGGTLIFSTNSGLTAGGTFFPSERMRITSAGNVGIGTTNPLGITNNSGLQIDRGGHTTIMIGNGTTTGGVVQSSDDARRVFIGANVYDDVSGSWSQFDGNAGYAAFDVIGDANYGLSRILVGSPGDSGYATSNIFFEAYKSDVTSYVKIRTATDNVLYLTNGGNVGIGTTAPAGKLSVEGDGTQYSNIVFKQSAAQEHLIYASTSFQYNLIGSGGPTWIWGQQGGSEIMRLNNTGLGIGTTAPSYKLDVNGTGRFGVVRSNYYDIPSGTGFNSFQMGADTSAGGWYVYNLTTGTYNFVISNGGNVGIGTTAPAAKLDVNGGIKINGVSSLTDNAYFVGAPSFGFRWNSSDDAYNNVIMYDNGNMYVRGNVGIGTTSPAQKFEVYGGTYLRKGITGTPSWANNTLELNSGGTDLVSLEFHRPGYSSSQIWSDGNNLIFGNSSGTERMRIQDGNVGIGTTSPTAMLDVNGSIRVTGRTTPTTGNGLELFYYSPSDCFYLEAYNYSTSAYKAIRYSGASHQFLTGNVGIGTTAPTNVLHVVGVPRFDANGGAPSDTSGTVVNNKYYGNNFVALTSPNEWLKVDINGTAYVIPAYSI